MNDPRSCAVKGNQNCLLSSTENCFKVTGQTKNDSTVPIDQKARGTVLCPDVGYQGPTLEAGLGEGLTAISLPIVPTIGRRGGKSRVHDAVGRSQRRVTLAL